MNLLDVIKTGSFLGLNTVDECIGHVECHYDAYFLVDEALAKLEEIHNEVEEVLEGRYTTDVVVAAKLLGFDLEDWLKEEDKALNEYFLKQAKENALNNDIEYFPIG